MFPSSLPEKRRVYPESSYLRHILVVFSPLDTCVHAILVHYSVSYA